MTVVPLSARVTEPPLALIMSAAYVEQELAAEFGHLPPCFLPVATQRLYEHQRSLFPVDWAVHVALPESFELSPIDRARLASLGLAPLALPDGLSLGDAVALALDLIDGADRPVVILHGDTLVDRLPVAATDWLAVAERGEGYAWAEIELESGRVVGLETVEAGAARERPRPVACGVFAFSHGATLARAIDRADGDFIRGIVLYGIEHRLSVVPVAAWYDFGHVQTFFRSRRIVSSARSFNTLQIDGRIARKTSADAEKMRAEAHWLDAVPPEIRIYAARLLREGSDAAGRRFYETEYAYLPTLSELFVFGTVGRTAWMRVLESCRQFLTATATVTDPGGSGRGSGDAALAALILAKTEQRLRHFADATGFSIDAGLRLDGRPLPSLMRIAADLSDRVDLRSGRPACVMHGDFCFSNILYDSRVQRVRVIDPRGTIAGKPTIYGDLRYDLAKLAHSIVGRYDQIIAGRYTTPPDDGRHFAIAFETAPHHAMLEEALPGFVVDGVSAGSAEVRAITAGLFLSMLPLHADRPDRQRAFIANALRLYAALEQARDKAA